MSQKLVSRAEFARMRGVSAMAVTKWASAWLAAACVGTRIDANHPDAVAGPPGKGWPPGRGTPVVAPAARPQTSQAKPGRTPPESPPRQRRERVKAQPNHQTMPPGPAPRRTRKRPTQQAVRAALSFDAADAVEPPDDEGSVDDLDRLQARVRPIVDRFGSMAGLKDWLFALKTIEEIRGKRLDNDENEGRLIPREKVRVHVFGAIEEANKRLLLDIPKNLARTLYAMAKSGTAVEEAEKTVREKISSVLRPVKDKSARALRKNAANESGTGAQPRAE